MKGGATRSARSFYPAGGASSPLKSEETMDYQAFLLALVMWREARGEGAAGMEAVAHVIVNRTRQWRQSLYEVICGQNQFSSMTVCGDSQSVRWPDDNDNAFIMARVVAVSVLDQTFSDTTGGALYYANVANIEQGGWFARNILAQPTKHARTEVIGSHCFFA